MHKHPMLAFREANGLSQADAAKRVGITQEMWSRIETETTFASPRVAKRIADLTGMALERLLNFGDNDPAQQRRDGTDNARRITKDLPKVQ